MHISGRSARYRQAAFRRWCGVALGGIALAIGMLTTACGRTDLYINDRVERDSVGDPIVAEPDADLFPEAAPPESDAAPVVIMGPMGRECVPTEETCNGKDDDCDGDVDEVAPIPCAGGGNRYCVGGRFSECPKRCETCIPGSQRTCQLSYCTFWGVQTCAADGRSFGVCREQKAPPECIGIAKSEQKSAKLEQCCVDNGYCCLDLFDLDNDNNTSESLGECSEVMCE